MDILRIATAGSVDDGKSTLLGRLLFDSMSLPKDRILEIEELSKKRGHDGIDFSLFTDGLVAERDQKITIDVAHIYFYSNNKKFIIADSPGHLEYLRNMITATSTSDYLILLTDASRSITDQTKRHLFIASLMKMEKVICVVNKMDLVDYQEEKFKEFTLELKAIAKEFEIDSERLSFVPISALQGDNVVSKSEKMEWYSGETVLSKLEALETVEKGHDLKLFVQNVLKDDSGKVFYTGRIKSGQVKKGNRLTHFQSGTTLDIDQIIQKEQSQESAGRGDSIAISFEQGIKIKRGDLITTLNGYDGGRQELNSTVCWLEDEGLETNQNYLLQYGTSVVKTEITEIFQGYDFEKMAYVEADGKVELNSIHKMQLMAAETVALGMDVYDKQSGYFILINEKTNNTAAVGLVTDLHL